MSEPAPARSRKSEPAFPIVGIGASAGGLEAFTELLKALPADTGMGFVLVQHLDPQHESALVRLLKKATQLPIREASNNLRVLPNRIYVIAPNTRLSIRHGILRLEPRDETQASRRTVDYFFASLAQDRRECAIGVVLSGTASDGTTGLEAIKAEGGITFAQDQARYDSMPRSAIAAGCVDFVLSCADIAKELMRIARHPYLKVAAGGFQPEIDRANASAHEDDASALPSGGRGSPRTGARTARSEAAHPDRETAGGDGYRKILLLLRAHSGVDFALYKSNTIRRRITRRMVLNKQDTPEAYAGFLRGNAHELDALYSDVLISVTSFFRNPDSFDALKSTVFPSLLKQRGDDPVRVWVLGCSTGQEAYSIAMAFAESADHAQRLRKLQVFATDLNEALLEKARHGLYARSLADDLSPERLRRFFVEEQGGYRIIKPLREMVVFARQNLISDPPFSRMDLISCRNLLIYLEPSLQHKAMPTFHYALRPGGFLFLGASESIAGFTTLFEPADKKHKIFSRKSAPTQALHLIAKDPLPAPRRQAPMLLLPEPALNAQGRGELNAQREADRVTVNQFAPPAVLINADMQILQFRGPTGAFLEPPSGKASFDVLKMARQGLMLPLRAAINQAKKEGKPARKDSVRVQRNGRVRVVNLEVIPLKNLSDPCFLVVFETPKKNARALRKAEEPGERALTPAESGSVEELQTDLAEARDYLQAVQEQNDAANEELQAASEEVQSANEELQSINEELETSKEELESANEELITVNEEMAHRNSELSRANSDLHNLQNSTRLAIVLVGRDLAIRSFSAQAEKQFEMVAADIGQSIGRLRRHLLMPEQAADLEAFVAEVIASVHEREVELNDREGRWFSLRVRPYFTLDNKIDGAVVVVVNIDVLKRSEQAIAIARDFAENIIGTVREPLLVLDAQLRVKSANRAFYNSFRLAPSETDNRLLYEVGGGQWDIPELRRLLEEVLPRDNQITDFELQRDFERIGTRTLRMNARRLVQGPGEAPLILLAMSDISEDRRLNDELRGRDAMLTASDRHKTEFLAMLAHELRNPLAPIRNAAQILRLRGATDEVTQSLSAMIERQVGQMVRLVDDLLDVSRINLGKIALRRERVELNAAVLQAVDAIRPAVEGKSHELIVELPPEPLYLSADAARLGQVIGNLLHNACKFTGPGGRIRVSLEHDHDDAVLKVRDNGIGIAASQLAGVFELFMQIDASLERSTSGLGIGLSLVKNLVEMHGGAVSADSGGTGEGAEFTVRLPLLLDAPKLQPATEVAVLGPRRILVVDDNRDSAASLAMILELSGHTMRTAHDGLEAVAAAEAFKPDLVLLDIGLPHLNGYEVARRIRQQAWGKNLLLIAVTGWGNDQDRRKSREAGFDGHLLKPVDVGVLMRLIAELSARREVA